MVARLGAVLLGWSVVGSTLWSFAAVGQEQSPAAPPSVLKTIELLETRNAPLDLRAGLLVVPDTIADERHSRLRTYARDSVAETSGDEFNHVRRIAAWVHARIQHDPFNAAPAQSSAQEILSRAEKGERFSCVEYSRVLKETLAAFGYVARTLSLHSATAAYGALGSGHVANEVWSNQLDQWFFVDAQWGLYAQLAGRPLSFYELYLLKREGRFAEVRFVPLDETDPLSGAMQRDREAEYRQFITGYFGYLSVRYLQAEHVANLVLPLAGTTLPLTFQGLGRSGQLFTAEARDHYFSLNHSNILLYYQQQASAQRLQGQVDIPTAEEYVAQMAEFAATPDFLVVLHHNMPWFDHFEVALDDAPWQRVDDNQFSWSAREGVQTLKARAVNEAGVAGPVASLTLRYGPKR